MNLVERKPNSGPKTWQEIRNFPWSEKFLYWYIACEILKADVNPEWPHFTACGVPFMDFFGKHATPYIPTFIADLQEGYLNEALKANLPQRLDTAKWAFHIAVCLDWLDGAKMLYEEHLNPNIADKQKLHEFLGQIASLYLDSRFNFSKTVAYALNMGGSLEYMRRADALIRTGWHQALAYALHFGLKLPNPISYETFLAVSKMPRETNLEIFKLIKPNLIFKGDELSEAMMMAAERAINVPVDMFLEMGANPKDFESGSLRMAVISRNFPAVATLLAAGANPHDDDDYALKQAAQKGMTEISNLLRKYA